MILIEFRSSFESSLIPEEIYLDGWNFYAGTNNGAVFLKSSPTPQLMITFADGQEVYTDRDDEIDVILARASAEKNYIAPPESEGSRRLTGMSQQEAFQQRLNDFDNFLNDYSDQALSPDRINSQSVYGKWTGFPRKFNVENAKERSNLRRWEIWYEKTGQYDSTSNRRRLRQEKRRRKFRAEQAAVLFADEVSAKKFGDEWLKQAGVERDPTTGELRVIPGSKNIADEIIRNIDDEIFGETADPLGRAVLEAMRETGFGQENNPNSYAARMQKEIWRLMDDNPTMTFGAAERLARINVNPYEATFHGTTKRNWDRIQEEGLKPSGNRFSYQMMEDFIDSGMEQYVEEFADGDDEILARAEDVIPLFEKYRFGDFYPEAIAEETVWTSDQEATAALFALMKWENQGKTKPNNPSNFEVEEMEGENYPIILKIDAEEENGVHFIIDDQPVIDTAGAEFRAFPFGVPASRIKVHRELKRRPGESIEKYEKRVSDSIWNGSFMFEKWVDNYNSGAYFKRASNNKRPMQTTWRTPAPQRMIDKVVWDRWDMPGASMPKAMTKAQAQSVANNIRNKKAGGGVHLARVVPVKGGYIVYERPRDRKWSSSGIIRRMKGNPNAPGGNLYLRRRVR